MRRVCVILTLFSTTLFASPLTELEQNWTSVLNGNIRPQIKKSVAYNALDYRAVSENPDFERLFQTLQTFPLSSLKTKNERLSFWVNTYNIAAVKMMLDHPNKTRIRDISSLFNSVWDRPILTIEGQSYSLGKIEHKILRKLDEPRIHFAIVCASLSCPDLKETAYSAQNIDDELDRQTQRFLSNPSKGYDPQTQKISKLFKWFKKDFKDFPVPENNGYLPYHWDKND